MGFAHGLWVRSPFCDLPLPEEFCNAIALTDEVRLKLSGLHFYRGTGTNATAAFTQVINTIIATAQQLPDWEYLDFGGALATLIITTKQLLIGKCLGLS